CGSMATWQKQKGRFYGACKRSSEECKRRPLLREDRVEAQLIEALVEIKDRSDKVLNELKVALNLERSAYIGMHRIKVIKSLNGQLKRLQVMEDALYEDKLAGLISDSRYQAKLADFAEQAEQIMARLSKLNEMQAEQDTDLPKVKNKIVALYL